MRIRMGCSCGRPALVVSKRRLDLNRAPHGLQRRGELNQKGVADGLDLAAIVPRGGASRTISRCSSSSRRASASSRWLRAVKPTMSVNMMAARRRSGLAGAESGIQYFGTGLCGRGRGTNYVPFFIICRATCVSSCAERRVPSPTSPSICESSSRRGSPSRRSMRVSVRLAWINFCTW